MEKFMFWLGVGILVTIFIITVIGIIKTSKRRVPCFIRIASPELCKKLESLGYEFHPHMDLNSSDCTTVVYNGYYWTMGEVKKSNWIDCGVNEDHFLSIAKKSLYMI